MDRERLRKTNAGGQTCIKVDKCTVNTINTRNIAASALQTMGIASPAPAHVDDAANLGGPQVRDAAGGGKGGDADVVPQQGRRPGGGWGMARRD